MSTSIRNSMKVGIVHFMAYPSTMSGKGPILESIDEIVADDFFDVIEVTHIEDQATRMEAAHRIHVSGMDVAFGSQPYVLGQKLNLHSRDQDLRTRSIEIIKGAIEEAVEIEAVGFATMSGVDPGEAYRAEESTLFVDSLMTLCEYARQLNPDMQVVIESFDRVPFGKNCLVGPTREAVEIVQQVKRTFHNFGLMIDLSHLPLLDETPEEGVKSAAPVLSHVHIGNCVKKDPNNPYYGDNHPPFAYEGGENSVDELVRYLKCLIEIGYINSNQPKIVTIEAKPLNDDRRPALLGNVKRNLNRALARL